MKRLLPILWFIVCAFAAGDLYAATLTVTKTEDTSDGVCDADCSLREAVAAAASGDTIVFSSLFNTPQTITLLNGEIAIDKDLTITGTGPTLIDISANLNGRIFNISAGLNVTMSGMKFRDGRVGATLADAYGGAIRVLDGTGTLNLSNIEFSNNLAFYSPENFGVGSAIYCYNCTMTLVRLNVHNHQRGAIYGDGPTGIVNITDSVLSDNRVGVTAFNALNMQNTTVTRNISAGISAEHLVLRNSSITANGRGIVNGDASATLTVENSIISGNSDSGLDASGYSVIRDSVISNNQYVDSGGGIGSFGTLYVINCAITGNTARANGGGIATYGQLFLANSTISGNFANGVSTQGLGGGIYIASPNGQVTITNSTITNNQSELQGGGIRRDSTRQATVQNTIIAGNTSTTSNEKDGSGSFVSQGTNLIGNTAGSSGWIGSDLLNVDPMLAPLSDNGGGTMTHALLAGSPALDAGNNSLAVDPQTQTYLTGDQRSFPRLTGSAVDIDAYESTQTAAPVVVGTITYGNAIGGTIPRFIANVTVNGVGSPKVSAASLGSGPGQGTFLLTGFGSGSYIVTPSKIGDVRGAITSFDSAKIAQHAAGTQTLSGNQLIVADVSGNGTISSFDAAQIARYAAGLNGFGTTGGWIFIPASRMYPSVGSNITGQDFIALLMGEVSGNWMDVSGRPIR